MKTKLLENEQYIIELNTDNNEYVVKEYEDGEWEERKAFTKYADASKYIEKREERKAKGIVKKKEPLLAIMHAKYGGDGIRHVRITSVAKSRYGAYAWVMHGKERSKESLSYNIYKETPANEAKFQEMRELQARINSIRNALEKYTQADIEAHFKEEDGE